MATTQTKTPAFGGGLKFYANLFILFFLLEHIAQKFFG